MSKKIEMTPAQSESKEKLFAEAYDYYAKHYFNINDFVKAVDYLRENGLSFAHIAKISGMTHKSLMQFYYRDQIEPCLLYTSPSPRDQVVSRMPSSA